MALNALRSGILGPARKQVQSLTKLKYSTTMLETYKTLAVSTPKPFVYMVQLNRPEKRNSVNDDMWQEFKECFEKLSVNPDCRAIVLSGAGKLFCAGIDINSMLNLSQQLAEHEDIARKARILHAKIKSCQESMSSVEKCRKPVIAAVHNACVGAGVDMISGVDMRYCTSDAWFQIKEVDLGMAADVGTLQRFPKVIGSESLARELAFTGRKLSAAEALQCGFVSRVYDNHEILLKKSIEIAEEIASKSPLAVQESKINMIYARDHSVQDGLDYIAARNQSMLQSEDFINAVMAQVTKDETPVFAKL